MAESRPLQKVQEKPGWYFNTIKNIGMFGEKIGSRTR
jgi:hypothetical protein